MKMLAGGVARESERSFLQIIVVSDHWTADTKAGRELRHGLVEAGGNAVHRGAWCCTDILDEEYL